MASFNLMFHVASAIAFVWLIVLLIRLQSRLQFQHQLWRALVREQRTVLVDWPQNFFAKLSRTWTLQLDWPEREAAPQKIELAAWVQCHAALGLLGVRRRAQDAIEVRVLRVEDASLWQARLEQALAQKFRVEIVG